MFGSKSYRLSKRSELESSDSLGSLGKITFRSDITDGSSPSNPFSRQNRPSTLPARFKRPTPRSPSAPSIPTFQNSPLSDPKTWSKNEEEDGVIFTATLKKVRYRSSLAPSIVNKDDVVSYLSWETLKKRVLKAGTLVKLIEHLTPTTADVLEEDSGFLVCFLCTYKTFASTEEVLDLLLQRYKKCKLDVEQKAMKSEAGNYVQSVVCRVFSIWLEQYPGDFDEPPYYPSLHKIINFTKTNNDRKSQENLLKKTEDLLDKVSVCPFVYEDPFEFKLCSCNTPIGCTCDKEFSPVYKNECVKIGDNVTITSFLPVVVAEQLTLVDADLFKRVVPRHCLACYWSKRDKLTGARAPVTIKATVDHFNAVVKTVTTTILDAVGTRTKLKDAQARAKVITMWITTAQECRSFKNFSSLKAILSGLQCTPIHRLKKTWPLLSKETQALYADLSVIFSDDLNSKASRDLLMLEGTAKYATIDGRASRKSLKKRRSMMKEGVMQGTVPYLGTFLTDLTMIDTAYPNKLKNGYISFDKKRKVGPYALFRQTIPIFRFEVKVLIDMSDKSSGMLERVTFFKGCPKQEFEVIAQIKLFQESAKNYQFEKNPQFITWFHTVEPYSEKESYAISCQLEPDERATTPQTQRRQETLRKHASVPDLLSKLKLDIGDETDAKGLPKFSSLLSKTIGKNVSPGVSPVHSPDYKQRLSPDKTRLLDDKKEIAKVMIDGSHEHVYKSIFVSADDRTYSVINKCLLKYDIEAKTEEYSLYQVIPDSKDLHLPHNTNVLYAINKSVVLKFKLQRRKSVPHSR